MRFTEFLQKQNARTDEVGWVARLILGNQQSLDEIQPYCGTGSLSKYAQTFPAGKMKRALISAVNEWIKESAAPQVGIFWIVDGEVVEFTEDANATPIQAGFKDTPFDHMTMWPKMQKVFPEFKYKEYDQVPRGRVIGVGQDGYRVFLPPDMVNNQKIVRQVMKIFNLPQNKTEVMGDEHYVTQTENELTVDPFDEDFEPEMDYQPELDDEQF